jgi:hypothetical protein
LFVLFKTDRMGLIIKTKKHYLSKLPLFFLAILLFSFLPILIGMSGAWVTELVTGSSCHEGNCFWMALPWLEILTLPIGVLILIIFIVVILIDTFTLFKSNKKHEKV